MLSLMSLSTTDKMLLFVAQTKSLQAVDRAATEVTNQAGEAKCVEGGFCQNLIKMFKRENSRSNTNTNQVGGMKCVRGFCQNVTENLRLKPDENFNWEFSHFCCDFPSICPPDGPFDACFCYPFYEMSNIFVLNTIGLRSLSYSLTSNNIGPIFTII